MKQILILLTFFLPFQSCFAQIADRVFGNGTIFTANDAIPFAEAIAVKDRRKDKQVISGKFTVKN